MTPQMYGVRESWASDGVPGLHAEEVATLGFTIVPDVLDSQALDLARERIYSVYEEQRIECGDSELNSISDADVARCLLSYDDFFVEVAAQERVLDIASRLLGEHIVLMSQNAIINRAFSDNYQQAWHRDLSYQHFVSSRPLAVSALYCIDEFSVHTGGTMILPASHKSEQFPSAEFVDRQSMTVAAAAGSVVMFDSMLFHRSGYNQSSHDRLAVNHVYTVPIIQQPISLPAALGGRFSDDPRLRTLLGYSFQPAASTIEWRKRRLGIVKGQE